jgi:hypothetical protein
VGVYPTCGPLPSLTCYYNATYHPNQSNAKAAVKNTLMGFHKDDGHEVGPEE